MATKRLGWDVWQSAFEITGRRKPYLHLERANSRGVCWCRCERALVATPSQMDCPWCGCGWLFSCMMCGKSFTYAKPVWLNQPLAELVERDFLARGYKRDAELFRSATKYLQELTADITEGQEYIYLDGAVIALSEKNIEFEGAHSRHKFRTLPHAAELKKPGSLEEVLANGEYWFERRIETDDESGN